ncbi:MAG TPA: dTMP kinase [Actinomycetota bacterium]|nr:dTMP kinase [Actinomycetota bacterium]
MASSFADEVAALRGTRPATLKDLVTHQQFSKLLLAQTLSSFGDWVGFVAVTALVLSKGGGYAVAAVMAARMLPAILFGPVAGAIVDRFDRKALMIGSDVARGTLYVLLPFLGPLWAIYVVSFVIECFSLLWTPARDASLPNLVPRRQLANATSLGLATTYGTLPLGGIVFAFLVEVSDLVPWLADNPTAPALWLKSATAIVAALLVARIAIPSPSPTTLSRFEISHVGRDIVDGVRFLREDSLASAMTLGIVSAFSAVGAVLALGPIFARTLGAGNTGWGILVTSFGIGMGIGMASSNKVVDFLEREIVFPLSIVGASATLFVLALMPGIELAAAMTVVLGAFCGSAWVSGYVLLQENVTDEFRGRTFASLTVLSRLGLFLSLTIFPIVADSIGEHMIEVGDRMLNLSGTRAALMVAGVGAILAGVVTRRGLRRFRIRRPEPLGLVPKLRRPPTGGLFVAFEGVEGAGKGTQIRLAKEWLEDQGIEVLVSREPGGTPIGEELRRMLLDNETGHLEPKTEALLFAASRAQHVTTVIRPALAEGKVVICDRYIDSSLAYQGSARGLGEQDVLTLNVWATQGLFPDLVLLLHLEPEAGLLRSLEEPDRFEMEGGGFHAKVSDAYLRIAEEHPERFVVIDADKPPEAVHEQVVEALRRVLKERESDDAER